MQTAGALAAVLITVYGLYIQLSLTTGENTGPEVTSSLFTKIRGRHKFTTIKCGNYHFYYSNYAHKLMLIICKSLQYEQIRLVKFDKNISN